MARRTTALVLPLLLTAWFAEPAGRQAPSQPDHYPSAGLLRQVSAGNIRAHMAFLADDLLEGRATGTRGYQLAAHYIRTQFQLFGLEPGGGGESWFQDIRFRRWTLVPERSWLSVIRGDKPQRLGLNEDAVLFGHPLRQQCDAEGPVAFVGYGVTAPEFGYDDYAGIDVKGKIVLMLAGGPTSLPPAPGAVYSSSEVKTRTAAERGAIGRITAWVGPAAGSTPFSRLAQSVGGSSHLAWLDASGAPGTALPGCAAVISPKALAAMLEGTSTTVKDLEARAKASELKSLPLPIRVSMRQVSAYDETTSPNVIGMLRGSDPRLRDEFVVVSAHADHVGIGEPVEGDAIYNGAVDNASGTAVLLELARAMAASASRPARSILFLAVTGEEEGLLGSDYFARHPTVPPGSIVANINMDMAWLFYDFADLVAFGRDHSTLSEPVAEAARRMGLTLSPDPMPQEAIFVRSDHYSFVRQGIPSLMLMGGMKPVNPAVDGEAIVMSWMGSRYHMPDDDMRQPLNFQAAEKYARANLAVAWMVAQAPERPRWNEGDFFAK